MTREGLTTQLMATIFPSLYTCFTARDYVRDYQKRR